MKEFTTNSDEIFTIGENGFSLSDKKGEIIWKASIEETITLYLTDNKHSLEVEMNENGEAESSFVHFKPAIYEEVKTYLKANLDHVKTRSLSIFRQLSFPSSMIATLGFLLGSMYYLSWKVESTGEAMTSGRKGAIAAKAVNYLTETVGSQMILIVGCVIVGLFTLMFLKSLVAPKKGTTIDFLPETLIKNPNTNRY